MTEKKITVSDVRKYNPCYDPTTIKGITETSEMSLVEVLKYKEIKDEDKIWIATRFLSETENRKFEIWCAWQCRTKVKGIKEYINAIENYYIRKTITHEQLMTTGRAAYSAADSAADWAVMRKKQIKYLIKMIKEKTNG